MPDIFLSYNREDQAVARRFAEGFERAGFSVWWDQALNPGEAFDRVTEQALEAARVVVVLWSKKSVESRWVRAEATQALGSNKLAPVMIEPCKRPIMFELTQTAELMHWKGDASDAVWQSFIAGLRRVIDKTSDGANVPVDSHSKMPTASSSFSKHKQALVLGGLALVMALAGVGYVLKPGAAPAANVEAKGTSATAQTEEHSIVVLPFRDNSPAHDSQAYADGTSEEITNLLGNIQELKVIAQTSANFFRDQQEDLAQMHERLGVEYVLTGSVNKGGDQLRINVQLADARDGRQLWQHAYAGGIQQTFEFQDGIAKQVAEAMQIRLGVGELARSPFMTRNVAAWEAFQKGSKLRPSPTQAFYEEFASHLEVALTKDPKFIMPAMALITLYEFRIPLFMRKSTEPELRRARELRTQLANDEVGRLAVKVLEIPIALNSVDILKAKRLRDELSAAFRSSGIGNNSTSQTPDLLLMGTGHPSEAQASLARSFALDPLNGDMMIALARATANSGDIPKALGMMKEWEARNKGSAVTMVNERIMNYMALHDVESLRQTVQSVNQQSGAGQQVMTDVVGSAMWSRLEDEKEALVWLRQNRTNPNLNPSALLQGSLWSAYFGDPSLALGWLSAVAKTSPLLVRGAIFSPNYAEVRKLPGFKQLVKDVGLVDYWRATHDWGDYCKPLPNTESDFECK